MMSDTSRELNNTTIKLIAAPHKVIPKKKLSLFVDNNLRAWVYHSLADVKVYST